MNQVFRIAGLLIMLLYIYTAIGNEPEQILTVGTFHSDEVNVIKNEEWLVLYSKNNKYLLSKSNIHISLVEDPVIDNPGDKTGKKVSIKVDGTPILLFKNIKNLVSGEAPVFISREINFVNKEPVIIQCSDIEYTIAMKIMGTNAKLQFSDGKHKQILSNYSAYTTDNSTYYFGDEASPSLIWAGDLDKDSKPDLIMNLTNHYNVTEVTLFLSSYASGDEIVKRVAVFRTVGC